MQFLIYVISNETILFFIAEDHMNMKSHFFFKIPAIFMGLLSFIVICLVPFSVFADSTAELFLQVGHSSWVYSACFSPDGKQIASGGDGNTVKIWIAAQAQTPLTLSLLPGNEWISWRPGRLFYHSSLQGDEYMAVRFNNQLTEWYPLTYYRDQLKRTDLNVALAEPDPEIAPRPVQRWWERTPKETLWKNGILGSLILVFIGTFFFLVLRKHSDPMEVSKSFFPKAGFKRAESMSNLILCLHVKTGGIAGMAVLWQDEADENELAASIRKHARKCNTRLKLYLIFQRGMPAAAFMQQLRESLKCEVIPVLSSRMEKALFTQKFVETLKELEDPFLTRIDPYNESKPVNDATWFYGRDELMDRLPPVLAQGQHVGVFGLRKVGKTSLLKQIQQRFVSSATVAIDCQAFPSSADSFFTEILSQITQELRARQIKGIPSLTESNGEDSFRKNCLLLFDAWKKSGGAGAVSDHSG